MKWMKSTVLLMTLALLLAATMSTTYGDEGGEANGLFSEVEGEPPPSTGVETITSRLVQIDFKQLDRAAKPPDVAQPATEGSLAEPPPPRKLSLNLFDDAVFTTIVQHVEPTSAGYALWGGLEGMELGSVTMVVNGSVVVGTVRTPQAVYTIRTLSEGVYVIRQIDESTLLPLGEPQSQAPTPGSLPQTTGALRDDGSEIDVMVVYTPTAKNQAGGRAGVETLIDLMVAETNQAYAQSGVSHRIRLVYRDEVDYIEDGNSLIDLGRFQSSSDGYMDRVHELRELYAADLVHLLVGTSFNVGGVANLLYQREDGTYSDSAFGLTVGNNSAGLIFAHELGHNMGLRHDRYQVLRNESRTNSIDGYNYGYVNQRAFRLDAPMSARWRTIMAYSRQCSDYRIQIGLRDFYCQRILRFSNPELTYNGDRLGVPVNHPSGGVDGPAHAVRALNENRQVVANFRQSSTSAPKVALTLSPYWLAENGGSSTVTAFLNRPASADTTVTVAVSRPDAVTLSANRALTIPAGQTTSVGAVTLTGVDNGNRTGDVIVTVSANASGEGVAGPDPVELAVADDETTPVVSLSLSPRERVERNNHRLRGRIFVTAALDNRSSAETVLTISASPDEAVSLSSNNILAIPAGQTASTAPVVYLAKNDDVFTQARKNVTISGTASNFRGVTGPEGVSLTILDDEAPIFAEDSIEYTFTAGVAGARFLPEAEYGNGRLTYSISPAPGNSATFTPGPPARIEVPATSAVSGPVSYTLTATDAQGDTDTMVVTVTVRAPVCSDSAAVSGYSSPGIVAECEALLASRDSLRGDGELNWSEHRPMEEWEGVHINRRVTRIIITGTRSDRGDLNGTIPSELGSLSSLRDLALWSNQLSGPMPPELGNLGNLERLAVSDNRLTGEIPESLGNLTNLRDLSLWGNRLTGQIPHSLTNLTSLEILWLAGNQFTGCIPEALRNVARNDLHRLGLPFCDELPPCPHDCELLLGVMDILVGDGNAELNWSAYVPISDWRGVTVSGTPPRVTGLNLQHADLRGSIPPLLGDLHSLELLNLGHNQLSGEIPAGLGNLTGLNELDLQVNQLSGEIPAALGSLTNLQRLYLNGNQLSGEIPTGLSNLTYLTILILRGNQLSGEIPAALGSLTNLRYLYLSDNMLTGCVPQGLRDVQNNDFAALDLPFCTDRYALVALYNATDGANWTNKTNWNTDEPIGEWHGVTTDADGSVTALDLTSNQLSGEIPSSLDILYDLQELRLGNHPLCDDEGSCNQLSGEIPGELGGLANLKELDLNFNQLTGPIPSELGNLNNLTRLNLTRNGLTGPVPQELGSLPSLEGLALGGNQLTGPVPSQLGNLANLQELYLSGNQLTGPVPAELGSLTNLVNLELTGNQLTGAIPSELGKLNNLTRLNLTRNELTGPVPQELGSLTSLEELALGGNQLTGPIPPQLGNLANLQGLFLWGNQLTGPIPTELSSLPNLVNLELNDNQLTGPIPSQLGNLTNLQGLLLFGNRLIGPIPSQLGNLTLLQKLRLGNVYPCDDEGSCNQLSGEIPSELGNLSNLAELDLTFNQLTGEIPSSLGNLANLQSLFLSGNQLTGEIPEELGNLAGLTVLSLDRNDLTGQIPTELGNLSSLGKLHLGDNRLTGALPATLSNLANLKEMSLPGNQLNGEIPPEWENLSGLEGLDLSDNQLTGPVPAWLSQLGNLEELYLTRNRLAGAIPPKLGSVHNLSILRLGGNQLTGEIPVELGTLTNLTKLSLSNNQLSGVVPQALAGLTMLELFYFYNNPDLCAPVDAAFQTWLQDISTVRGSSCAPVDSPEDRAVLVKLHEATGGAGWGNSANWLSDRPVREWHGVVNDARGQVTGLFLPGNQLTGTIPSELGNLSSLEWLSLWDNELTGEIPLDLGNLTSLRSLSLRDNQLSGEIPSELGGLTNLTVLYLSGNQLTGCVPEGLWDVMDNDFAQLGLTFCTPVDPLVARYDANGNGTIERSEAIAALRDYLSGVGGITRSDAVHLLRLYLSG